VTDSLDARVRRLEDILEIQQIFIDYGLALDAGDFDRYASLFAESGTIALGPMGRATGRAAIKELMERTMRGRVGQSLHIVSSPQITFDDSGDTAHSQVMWTVVHRDEVGQPRLTMMGRHQDELVRENGRWKIARRRGLIDMPSRFEHVDG
jgi:uncharacterized protein (TIGR02246 family)